MAKIHTDGNWVNVGEDPAYKAQFSNLGGSKISWGTAVGTEKSSYEFEGNAVQADVDGPPFVLGTFTHHNFPIYIPFERFWADLKVTMTIQDSTKRDFIIRFSHYESPNRGPVAAQADVVDLPNVKVEKAVKVDGVECDLLITGFYWHDQEEPTRRFRSPEGARNEADLHVQLSRYRGPR
ncbi:choice-of-anchor K domain-containing protein [Streptomyces sp. NPDC003006]